MSAWLLVGLLLTGPDWPCDRIPDEPAADEATSEGPAEMSGLYFFRYDLGGGNELVTYRVILLMALTPGLEAEYSLQRYPLMVVVIRPGYANVVFVDRGHGLLGVPQGLCNEIVRYQ